MKRTGGEGKSKKIQREKEMEMKENNVKGKKIGQTKQRQGKRKLEKGKRKKKIIFSSLFRVM